MASLCISCIIIFSILTQRACCEEDEEFNVTLTGYIGYYSPVFPSPERDSWLRRCRITPKLSWGKWENIEPSKCSMLSVRKNCVGYALSNLYPAMLDFIYTWRRQNPAPKCDFQHEGTMMNGLRFNHFTEYNATQIMTIVDRLCINLPINLKYTSVEKSGVNECIKLYEREDCVGDFYELSESTPNYVFVPLNRVVNSFKPCNPKTVLTPTSETDKHNRAPQSGNLGEKGLTINVAEPGSSNVAIVLFGLLSLILLLLVSALIFGVFYFRRRFFPHLYEVEVVAEQQELTSFRQSMSERQTKDIYGPVLEPQRNSELISW